MFPIVRLLAICFAIGVVSSNSLRGVTKERVNLLVKYGYLSNGTGSALRIDELTEGLKNLQEFAGIPVTGQLNSETIKLLESDRCGMKDNYTRVRKGSIRIGRALIGQYRLQGTYWNKRDLTYKVISYTPDLPRDQQRRIFKDSFDMWQAATNLKITDVTDYDPPDDSVDILISFVRRYHQDPYPFDGRGGTLAHAFYPHNNKGLSGDAHFDDDENFTTQKEDGINLDWVALHEFGHSLGLQHSNVKEAVMYPWYKGYKKDIKLTKDDVQGIQALYGYPPKTTKAPTQTTQITTEKKTPQVTTEKTTTQQPTTAPEVLPEHCKVRSYDTFFNGADDKTYAVSGDYYWHIVQGRAGKESGPHKLTERFPGLQTTVDAAYTKDGITVFFKGSKYWRYSYRNNKFIAKDTAKPMSQLGLPSALNDMDAAFVYRNNRIYFLKGKQYWRYNEGLRRIDWGYPRSLSRGWKGMTGTFDAAMTWSSNGKTYFFKGEDYKRIHPKEHRLDSGYPQNIALKWMRCNPRLLGRMMIGSLSAGNEP